MKKEISNVFFVGEKIQIKVGFQLNNKTQFKMQFSLPTVYSSQAKCSSMAAKRYDMATAVSVLSKLAAYSQSEWFIIEQKQPKLIHKYIPIMIISQINFLNVNQTQILLDS